MNNSDNRILTATFALLSGVIGGFFDYYFQNENLHLKLSPALFGVSVLLANHSSIRLSKNKIIGYLLIIPISIVLFVYGGLVFSIFGFGSEISVYIGSGLCAVAMAIVFRIALNSIVIDWAGVVGVFFSGAVALFIFFTANGYPLDRHFRGVSFDKFYILSFIWQTLVGFAISMTIRKRSR